MVVSVRGTTHNGRSLHSTLVDIKFVIAPKKVAEATVYIPLWLILNEASIFTFVSKITQFTFHFG